MKAPVFWQAKPPSLVARLLQPIGAVYGAVTAHRMGRPRVDLGVPIICVGNFTVGGEGKTPAAMLVAGLLIARGERVFFLSRGYGGARRPVEPVLVDPAHHDFRDVGDEPLLLARTAPVIVGANRTRSAQAARAAGASVLIMDDGLQSAGLRFAFALAVVDSRARFGNGLCVPAGPLRAQVGAQVRHVDAVLRIGAQEISDLGTAPIFSANLQPAPEALAALGQANCLAFAGIGRPDKFFATLEEHGIHVHERRAFPDHYPYSSRDLQQLARQAKDGTLRLVTTEKDFVRLPAAWRDTEKVLALPVALELTETQKFSAAIFAALENYRDRLPS